MDNKSMRNFAVWALIITLFLVMISVSQNSLQASSVPTEYTYSELTKKAAAGEIQSATIDDTEGKITGETTEDKPFEVNGPIYQSEKTIEMFQENNVPFAFKEVKRTSTLMAVLINALPLLLIVGLSIMFFRSMQSGGRGGAMSFGKSRAKMLTENTKRVTFEDVAGVESAKEDLKEVVEFLQDPGRFTRLGARIPTGALLVGPPGTGKTLLARAVAGEAGVPFFTISGSDFVEMFVGVGASRVREMFAEARKQAPCIIFIDEIDAVGRHRGVGTSGGHEAVSYTHLTLPTKA